MLCLLYALYYWSTMVLNNIHGTKYTNRLYEAEATTINQTLNGV